MAEADQAHCGQVYDFDFFVIGGGSGGVRAARIAAQYGARVAIAEEARLGGTCVNLGCIPKKLFAYAAHFSEECAAARGYGWRMDACRHDWATLTRNVQDEITRLNGIYRNLLEKHAVTLLEGRAKITAPHRITVGEKDYTAAQILIATGGQPVLPDMAGAKEYGITSDDVFTLPEKPRRLVIVGGGYIAVEFAGIFAGLGAEVALVYRRDLFLRGFDDDLRTALAEEMQQKGIRLIFNQTLGKIEKQAGELCATLSEGDRIKADQILFATGRQPKIAGLWEEGIDIATDDKGAILVDKDARATIPHIYAVGDVTDRVNLTPVAIQEGHALADRLFGGQAARYVDYDTIPTAVFSSPPIGTVGLSEAQARETCGEIRIYKSRFRPLRHTVSGSEEKVLVKLVVEAATERVVGAHMLGADAPEIIQALAIALKAGLTKAGFDATIAVHPTTAEEFVLLREPV